MTVAELIGALQKLPDPSLPVIFDNHEDRFVLVGDPEEYEYEIRKMGVMSYVKVVQLGNGKSLEDW